jgi:predicted RNA-binding protein with PUA-like domain
VTLPELRADASLGDMVLLRKGSRLSVQPVTAGEWKRIVKLGARK